MISSEEKSGDKKAELTSTFKLSLRPIGDLVEDLLANATSEERKVIESLDSQSAMLVILGGPGKGARFLVNENQTRLGRAPENEIFLDDITVSRRHAEITRAGNRFSIRDAGSLNGTYLNGTITTTSDLKNGDEVQIGKFRLHFFSGGQA